MEETNKNEKSVDQRDAAAAVEDEEKRDACSAEGCDDEEGFEDDDDLWQEGYEQGMIDGWCQAATEVIDQVYCHFDEPEQVRDLLFPGLSSRLKQTNNLHQELMAHVVTKERANKVDSEAVSAWDEENTALGRRGEEAAARYLERHGYQILERNWRCNFGEADIIALDEEGTIVFVEVKTRRSENSGLPEEAVTPEKRGRYERIALCYLSQADWNERAVRFDAIAIGVNGSDRALLRHHYGFFDGRC